MKLSFLCTAHRLQRLNLRHPAESERVELSVVVLHGVDDRLRAIDQRAAATVERRDETGGQLDGKGERIIVELHLHGEAGDADEGGEGGGIEIADGGGDDSGAADGGGDVLAPPTRTSVVKEETGELESGGEIEREQQRGGAIGESEGGNVDARSEIEAKIVNRIDSRDLIGGDNGASDSERGLTCVGQVGGQLRGNALDRGERGSIQNAKCRGVGAEFRGVVLHESRRLALRQQRQHGESRRTLRCQQRTHLRAIRIAYARRRLRRRGRIAVVGCEAVVGVE